MLRTFRTWREYERILAMTGIAVFARAQTEPEELYAHGGLPERSVRRAGDRN
jgi:nicotinic acid mononucleotide adenylyltransferase